MRPFKIQSEHYFKALIIVLSVYVGSFVYLELTTVKKEDMLSTEGLYEVALQELSPEEKDLMREQMNIERAEQLRNIARDANDQRMQSYENWSAQTSKAAQGDPEQAARDYEAEVFAQTGGEQTRANMINQSKKRIEQLKQKNTTNSTSHSNNAAPNQYAGAVMVDFSVNRRTALDGNTWYVRNPGYTCGFNASGLVYVQIQVNSSGKVSAANYQEAKSINASPCMIEQAIKYAKMSRFSPGDGSENGWISYQFESQ